MPRHFSREISLDGLAVVNTMRYRVEEELRGKGPGGRVDGWGSFSASQRSLCSCAQRTASSFRPAILRPIFQTTTGINKQLMVSERRIPVCKVFNNCSASLVTNPYFQA